MPNGHLPHDHGQPYEQVLAQFEQAAEFREIAGLFHQLGDPVRLRIFWILCHCEECVINISAMVGMSSPAVSHHLKQLKEAGLIVSRRDGKEVYYTAVDQPRAMLLHNAVEQLFSTDCPICSKE